MGWEVVWCGGRWCGVRWWEGGEMGEWVMAIATALFALQRMLTVNHHPHTPAGLAAAAAAF